MQIVNQLSQSSNSTEKVKSTAKVQSSVVFAFVLYLVIAISLIAISYMDNGFLLTETISALAVVGLLLVIRFIGKEPFESQPEGLK